MNNRYTRMVAVVIACLAIILSIINARSLVVANGCVDLRCRIIGTRLSLTDHSPYFYKWNAADGSYLLDPNDKPGRSVNGNVVTPAVFKTFYFLAPLHYSTIKSAWAIFQYLFLFGSILLLAKKGQSAQKNNLLAALVVMTFYLCSNIWFYNIERGQMYTFYLFIFSIIYRLYRSNLKHGKFLAGFVNVVAIFMRPLAIVFLFTGVLHKDKKWMAGCICGAITGAFLFVFTVIGQWRDYSAAMKTYSYETQGKQFVPAAGNTLPAIIEGETNLQKARNFNCGGLSTVQYYLAAKGVYTNAVTLAACFCLLAAACSFLYVKNGKGVVDEDRDFLFAFFLYILSELFIIGYRGGYNQVEWVFGVFLLFREKALTKILAGLILLAILLENISLQLLRYQFEFAEIMLIGILFYFIMLVSDGDRFRLQKK